MESIENMFFKNIDKTRDQTTKCAFSVLEYITDENLKTKYLKELEKVLVMCVESEHAVALSRRAAKEAEARSLDENTNLPSAQKFDEAYVENMEELEQDAVIEEIINNAPSVKAFREQLQAQIVPVSANIDDDTDLVTTQHTINLTDPISKMPMTDPVRNKHCGHVYERSTVTNMIKSTKRKKFRCPCMGCGYREPIKLTDLEDALDVKRQIILQKK
ncbi:hypothetical protein OTU49_002122 [Cherax quadricarinatus]|uniref:E3 SUMO-protein ligase NSE2 n=1 Tax=Cherax quadricarinatus TaxID=27406 RepID=A0AAW0XCP7_CHEQU|nr:E3 SUMO-protein ligase NSE2-like [Cherax quadricarinatus]